MTAPEVSVVIPTHNRRALLTVTLSTVLAQRDVDFEVLVVDDGSSDGTGRWLRSIEDARLRVLRHDTARGVARARNHGIAEAHGTWIAFLDDDDVWAPHKLARQRDALRAADGVWAVSNVVDVDGRTLTVTSAGPLRSPERMVESVGWSNAVPAGSSNVLVAAEVVRDLGGFDEALRHFADWDLWVRLARSARPVTVGTPDVAYRAHTGNASASSRDAIDEVAVVGARAADLRGGAPIDPLWVYRWIGWWSLLAGNRRDAVWAYAHAVRRGDLRSLGRLAVGLAGPRIAGRALRRPVDAAIAAEAETWLAPLRGRLSEDGAGHAQGEL